MLKGNLRLLIFFFPWCVGIAPEACSTVGCVCEGTETKQTVSCIDNGFTEISREFFAGSFLPQNTTELLISRNPISIVKTGVLVGQKYRKLKKLDISGNKIAIIEKQAFAELGSLLRLNLSSNRLTELDGETFFGLRNLKALYLAKNNLYFINKSAFEGLSSLKKLDLTFNRLMGLPDGTLDFTSSLQRLLLQGNLLICDCQLKWLHQQGVQQGVQVSGTCQFPSKLKRKKFASLSEKSMTCRDLELPNYLFTPGNEISFKGSEHVFTCQATWTSGTRLQWFKNKKLISPNSQDKNVKITTGINSEDVTITSTFYIQELSDGDNGLYVCNISRPGGYERLGKAHLYVIHPNSKVCKAESTQGNRGNFHWYDTVVGAVAYVQCPNGHLEPWRKTWKVGMAKRSCANDGEWGAVQDSGCAYDSQATTSLHSLNVFPLNRTSVKSVILKVLNISSGAEDFQNAMDIVYIAEIVKKISTFISCNKELGARVLECISNTMNADSALLDEAQRKTKACSSMVKELDFFSTHFASNASCPQNRKEQIFRTENIAVAVLNIVPGIHKGKTCNAKVQKQKLGAMKCTDSSNYTLSRSKDLGVSLHLPQDLFHRLSRTQNIGAVQFKTLTFQSTVYLTSKLFPVLRSSRFQVISSVVSAHFRGVQLTDLVHPILFEFKKHMSESPELVSWNHSANGGLGSWGSTKGCNFSWSESSSVARCYQLKQQRYFALKVESSEPSAMQGRFSLEPVVYVGAGVCGFLILITLVTFLFFRELRYNRDDAAMLMNECLALVVVVIVFATGINHMNNALMCRAVGVLLHYFLLCCLLWVGCGGVCLLRHIRTALQPEEYNPVLRYYMISWGIPLIICGITVAGNPDNYSTDGYCWLRPQPFLGAFIGPACLMLIVDLIILLRLNHRRKAINGRNSENNTRPASEGETDGQTNTEEENLGTQLLSRQNGEGAMPPHGEMLDFLRGSAIVLFLIVVNFALGVTVVRFQEPRYLNLAVSCAYAVANILLGFVIFLFHCYKKEKALGFWKSCCRSQCCKEKKYLLESEVTSDVDGDGRREAAVTNDGAGKFHTLIHGAINSDDTSAAQSNVSLPSSAALTIDRVSFTVEKEEDGEREMPENAPSVSDKQSCSSAPLPFSHSRTKLQDRPAGYRHSYCAAEEVQVLRSKIRAPLKREAPPIAPSENLTSDSLSNRALSESAASEKSCARNAGDPNVSCSASEASETDVKTSRRKRPAGQPSAHERVSTSSKNRSKALPVVQEHVPTDQNMQGREMPSNIAKHQEPNKLQGGYPNTGRNQAPQPIPAYPSVRNAFPKSVPREYYPTAQYALPYQGPLGQHQIPHGQAVRMPREQQVARVRPVPHDSPPNTVPTPAEQQVLHSGMPPHDRVLYNPDVVQGQQPINETPAGQQPIKMVDNTRKEKTRSKQPNNNLLHPNSAKDQAKRAAAAVTTPTSTPKKVARVKPTPKQWEAEPSCRVATYVPVPHLKNYKSYSETSI